MQHRATQWRMACAAAIALATVAAGLPVGGAIRDTREKTAQTPPLAYDVDVAVDLDAGVWSGRETVRYVQRSRMPAREVVFNLYPNAGSVRVGERLLEITAASLNGVSVQANTRGGELRLEPDPPIMPGANVEIVLEFRGRAVRLTAEEMDLSAHVNDQVSMILNSTERRRVMPGKTTTVGGDAMLLGNPFPMLAARGGRVGGEQRRAGDVVMADAAAWRIRVEAPTGVEVVASGNRSASPGPKVTVFEGAGLRTVAVFASRGHLSSQATAAGARLACIYAPKHALAARRALEAMRGAVEFYTETFGPAPFRELTLVEAPLAPGTSSAAFSGLIAVASAYSTDIRGEEGKDLPGYIRDTPELMEGEIEFAAMHEAAKQWWGELVGSDPQRSAYLEEGTATYSAVMALEALRGKEAAAKAIEQRLRAPYRVYRMFGGQDETAHRRANDFPNWFAYQAIVETKGGLLMGAVRERLGHERFVEGLRRFAEGHAGKIARPEDLLDALAPKSDPVMRKDVEKLFERWLRQRFGDADIGAPEYAVGATKDVAKKKERGPGSPFEWFGRLIVRKLVQVGKATAKPF
ncbi:MAG: hypothetical protein IPF53_08595 [Blastocatellia bacterium]|nr:hypothetical protein [Blastocatellia bacterium]